MKNRYTIWRCLTAFMLVMVGVCACTDELEGLGISSIRPTDVICFTASLSDNRPGSQTRSASGHLEIEQEEWLVGTEQSVTRGTPVTLLEGSAGVFGYVYGTWQEYVPADGETTAINGTSTWSTLYNKKFVFDGDELTAESDDVRWATLTQPNVKFYAYAPYNLTGGTLSSKEQGGSPKITYTVSDTPSEQHDLIVASWEGQSSYKQSIPLVFNHALTAVRFKVGFECTVTKIEVIGIYNSGTYTFGEGWEVSSTTQNYEISSLTDEANTLMMIPQKLGPDAKVVLHYTKDGQQETINSSLTDKVWQAGKMITYTIHETTAPTTIYFDLAAGDITLNQTTYTGARYISDGNGGYKADPVTGNHNDNNIYYVYQSTAAFNKDGYSILDNKGTVGYISGTFIRPPYSGVKGPNGEPWADYITNNKSVKDVIEMWDDGVYIKGSAASNEGSKSIAKVRDAGRTHTGNKISVSGAGKYKLTIDNIYSAFQQASTSRTTGGIAYTEGGAGSLTINSIGDNRVGCVHKDNSASSKLIFEGTGTLTVADTDFITKVSTSADDVIGDMNHGYYSNHWNAAIGNNDNQNDCYGIVINSGVIFAGTTKAENCTAIGGGGNGVGNVTINGGIVTAVATTTGSAIGGGIGFTSNGGVGQVTITGGNVYAYNLANRWNIPSSAIGGGGTKQSTVNKGTTINISGGNIYAESDLGTAIGGGSSYEQSGGEATINISGGKVVAKSNTNSAGIGGGCSITKGSSSSILNGGDAIVNISGNPIIRTGSIGGGTTGAGQGKIGSAQITISGGDIQAQFVMMNTGTGTKPKFEMSGGTIRNSYVDDEEYIHIKEQGGAVYLENGTFTMSGGTIKNCSAEQGGAVYINSQSGNSTFTMTGGEIYSCFATGGKIDDKTYLGHGGAVCLMGGEVNMEGGKIWNNYSENGDGGAVYISNGNFSMTHSSPTITDNYPTITGNAAHKGNGGGVFVSSENGKSVKVDLLQGIITNNTANNYGGGICVDMGNTENAATVTVGADGQGVTESDANPKISGNMAMMSGGGLYVRGTNANVTINSGMIDDNKISAYVKNQDVANEMGGVTLNAGLVTHVVVTFDGNGGKVDGTGTDTYTQNIVTNTNSKLALNRFERAGYNFAGWNTRADGLGDSYSEEDAKPHSRDITLYAQWEAQQ